MHLVLLLETGGWRSGVQFVREKSGCCGLHMEKAGRCLTSARRLWTPSRHLCREEMLVSVLQREHDYHDTIEGATWDGVLRIALQGPDCPEKRLWEAV